MKKPLWVAPHRGFFFADDYMLYEKMLLRKINIFPLKVFPVYRIEFLQLEQECFLGGSWELNEMAGIWGYTNAFTRFLALMQLVVLRDFLISVRLKRGLRSSGIQMRK